MSKDQLSTQTPLINFIRSNSSLSRRDVLNAIESKMVRVNKQLITDTGYLVSGNDSVYIDNQQIKPSTFFYYKFNKPIGTLSTFKDPKNRMDLTYHLKKYQLPNSLKPCGRLDVDSSGLLLFSNDGHFINHVLHPKYTIKKTYAIVLDKPLSENDKKTMNAGFFLSDGPVSIEFDKFTSNREFNVIISMGRNRILRRSFEHFGYSVTTLHRLSIGPISIGSLKPGEFQSIDPKIIKILVQE